MAEVGRRFAQAQGDEFCLGSAIEQFRRWRCYRFLANQHPFTAVADECLPHVYNRPRSVTDRLADFGGIPSWFVGVKLHFLERTVVGTLGRADDGNQRNSANREDRCVKADCKNPLHTSPPE
jgi:hypothetical protein